MLVENIVSQIATQLAVKRFSGILENVVADYVKKKNRKILASSSDITKDINNHFDTTFIKCTQVKTILNSDSSAKTLEIYVEQRFSLEEKNIDQILMDELIRQGTSTIITGEGGGGKSMFMKYLWLSYFERRDEKIPIFLELRNLNKLTHRSISDFIFHSIIKSGSTIPQKNFEASLCVGEFILLLDGFDEVNLGNRDWVQSQILELQENNPDLTIVMTSRPDERFIGWQNFKQAHVKNLSKKTSRQLIKKANCDKETKVRFLKSFDKFYSEYESFMSNPLLAYMMLVLFRHNPDIPNKMFQFYEQSFEALYYRHDLTKDYKREFHTKLDKDAFVRLTSYLCLKTYYEENVEFSRGDLLRVVEDVKKIESTEVDALAFIDDLMQSVCILKKDGLMYTFTHRSFQEYFAAYCISRVAARNHEKLFSTFSKRHSDKVLPMVADINPDLFREKYLIPNHRKFKSFIDRKSERNLGISFANKVRATFLIINYADIKNKKNPSKFRILHQYKGEMSNFYRTVNTVTDQRRTYFLNVFVHDNNRHGDIAFFNVARTHLPFRGASLRIEFKSKNIKVTFFNTEPNESNIKEEVALPEVEKILYEAFLNSDMNKHLEVEARRLIKYVKNEIAQYNQVSTAFSDII